MISHETKPLQDTPDTWHDHTRDALPQMPHTETVNTSIVLPLGIASFVLVVVTCLVVYGYYQWYTTQLRDAALGAQAATLEQDQYEAKQQTLAGLRSGYIWVDGGPALGPMIQLPIDGARQNVIDRYAAQQR